MKRTLSPFLLAVCLSSPAVAVPVTERVPGFVTNPVFAPDTTMSGDRAFLLTRAGEMRDLGDLPGGDDMSVALDMDATGRFIVGESGVEGGLHAFRWTDGRGMTDLGDLPGGPVSSVANAVNADGIAVGQGHGPAGPRAVAWHPERGLLDLHDLAAPKDGVVLTEARDIDGAGRIVGHAEAPDGTVRVFIYDLTRDHLDIVPDATATSGLRFATVTALGADGAVLGQAVDADGNQLPALWRQDAGIVRLDDRSGTVNAMTADGFAAGRIETPEGARAMLWDTTGTPRDLNDAIVPIPGVTLLEARGFYDNGAILVFGRAPDGLHFYRLTPGGEDAPIGDAQLTRAAWDGTVQLVQDGPRYGIEDLGAFQLSFDGSPALSSGPDGAVVGGCDLLAAACQELSEFQALLAALDEGITNFVPDDVPDGIGEIDPVFAPAAATSGNGVGTQLSRQQSQGPGGGAPGAGGFAAGTGGGSSSGEGDDDAQDGVTSVAAVPLPPAGLALLGALGLMGWTGRRRRNG